jgi:hypothetical protein
VNYFGALQSYKSLQPHHIQFSIAKLAFDATNPMSMHQNNSLRPHFYHPVKIPATMKGTRRTHS